MGVGLGIAAGLTALAAGTGMGIGIHNSNVAKRKAQTAREQQQENLQQSASNYAAYRPKLNQANTNSLQQTMGLLKPLNNKMGDFFGSGAKMDLDAAARNPFAQAGQTGAEANAATGASFQTNFLGPNVTKRLMELYHSGHSPPVIAQMTGLSLADVQHHIQRVGGF